jgi:hypothetical protein
LKKEGEDMDGFRYQQKVERWDVFEVSCPGFADKNPFTGYTIQGIFKSKSETKTVDGFYDDGGIYRVRFMPSFAEDYEFELSGAFSDKKYTGNFSVTPASKGNHGPVHAAYTYHFAYEDGTPYFSIGTTCYVWEFQSEELQRKTLETLRNGPFNKIRFCVFPKHYEYNFNEPRSYPYIGKPMDSSVLTKENFRQYIGAAPGNDWDFKRFNVDHFRYIENCIMALRDLGIEADLIVMHPYDRWGFSTMDAECDDLYWKYVIARFAAYRNVWWSLANEYDLMPQKKLSDWERYASIICEKDPYKHPRSIHNWRSYYDYTRPWVSHCSIQRTDMYKCAELTADWRVRYQKPIVIDEMSYEGNIEMGWGSISGREMVRRFWEASCRGGYAGHGETFIHPQDILWWSHGGTLHGESPTRLAFLYKILCETPGPGLKPVFWGRNDEAAAAVDGVSEDPGYYLIYYSFNCYSFREFHFDDENEYHVEVIDTWNMTIEDRGSFRGSFRVDLPGREYMAVRIRRKANHG